jgi:hypothetical protein
VRPGNRFSSCLSLFASSASMPSLATLGTTEPLPAISTGATDEIGGGFSGLVRQAGQHTGVGVGSQHDAVMAKQRLDDLEVIASGERQAGSSMA